MTAEHPSQDPLGHFEAEREPAARSNMMGVGVLKKLDKETVVVLLGATLVLMVPSVCALTIVRVGMNVNDVQTQDLDKAEDPPPIVTLAEFGQIRENMSYQQVVDLIGDPGIVAAPSTAPENDAGDVETRMHVWQNSDASNMSATFQNDRLVKKAQLYLK